MPSNTTQINQLPAASALTGSDVVPVQQGGTTKKATVAAIAAAAPAGTYLVPGGMASLTGLTSTGSVNLAGAGSIAFGTNTISNTNVAGLGSLATSNATVPTASGTSAANSLLLQGSTVADILIAAATSGASATWTDVTGDGTLSVVAGDNVFVCTGAVANLTLPDPTTWPAKTTVRIQPGTNTITLATTTSGATVTINASDYVPFTGTNVDYLGLTANNLANPTNIVTLDANAALGTNFGGITSLTGSTYALSAGATAASSNGYTVAITGISTAGIQAYLAQNNAMFDSASVPGFPSLTVAGAAVFLTGTNALGSGTHQLAVAINAALDTGSLYVDTVLVGSVAISGVSLANPLELVVYSPDDEAADFCVYPAELNSSQLVQVMAAPGQPISGGVTYYQINGSNTTTIGPFAGVSIVTNGAAFNLSRTAP